MTNSGFRWKVPPTEAFPEMFDGYTQALMDGVEAIAKKWAPQVQNWMRDNASWTDRTGNARQALHTEVHRLTSEVFLIMAHGVDYGVFLELGFSGRYAIIGPAIDAFWARIWNDVKAMVSR